MTTLSGRSIANPAIANPVKAIVEWCRKHMGHDELSALGSDEVKRMASDLNLGVDDLISLAASPVADPSLMEKMMALHGLDADDLRRQMPGLLRDMEVTCSHCKDRKTCAHDLAEGADAGTCDQYCLNADTMKELAQA